MSRARPPPLRGDVAGLPLPPPSAASSETVTAAAAPAAPPSRFLLLRRSGDVTLLSWLGPPQLCGEHGGGEGEPRARWGEAREGRARRRPRGEGGVESGPGRELVAAPLPPTSLLSLPIS